MLRRIAVTAVLLTYAVIIAGALHPVGNASAAAKPDASKSPPGTPPMMPPGGPPTGGAQGGPGGPGGMRPGMGMNMPAATDSFASERDSLMKEVLEHIAGRETVPAESVFKNIKILTGVPAGQVLRIMNNGWGRALGTSCRHCHVLGHWADEDKPQKQITREMSVMLHTINTDLLPKIKNLHSERPGVSCTTCHRGSVIPARNM
jgi:hypothetical protein